MKLRQRHIPLKEHKGPPEGGLLCFLMFHVEHFNGCLEFTHFRAEDTILAVPKIFCGVCLEYFDRGAKPCSLFRPLGALRRLCST